MSQKYDVALISIYGRANWLAAELAEKGKSVVLIDVSQLFGHWAPEDWEGPFGFFHADTLKASQKERLSEDDYHEAVDEGFVLWLSSGPIELKGSLSAHWLSDFENQGVNVQHVSGVNNKTELQVSESAQQLQKEEFQHSWFAHLSHQMASNVFLDNNESVRRGRPLNLFSPYYIRRVSRRGLEQSLNWCKTKGVTVISGAKVVDMQVDKKSVSALEVESAHSEVIDADNFIWMLSSDESQRFSKKITETLYPNGAVESQWAWVRYRLKLSKTLATESLPLKFVIIDDLELTWAYENMCLVQKTVQEDSLDVWVRIPTQHRFQKSYLENLSSFICKLIHKKVPESYPEVVDMPQDYHYNYEALGPPRFPVYDREELKTFKPSIFNNVYYDGPEFWVNMDWVGQFQRQERILKSLSEHKGEST